MFRLLILIGFISVNAQAALPYFSGSNNTLSPEEQATNNYKQAEKALLKANSKRKTGYDPLYAPTLYPGSLYADLAENPDLISLYTYFCNAIYVATHAKNGQNMDYTDITNTIGDEALADSGYTVMGTFKRWDQFSGALLYNQNLNRLLIIFAGTATKMDLLKDLMFTKHKGGDEFGIVPPDYNVHKGVAEALIEGFKDFHDHFMNIADAALHTGNLSVITMGHSLGGGISLLAADYLKRMYVPHLEEQLRNKGISSSITISNLSFGAPRIYSKATALQVEERLGKGNVVRFWSSLDPVPAIVSGTLTNSKHVGLGLKITDSILRSTKPGIGWHSMNWYLDSTLPTLRQYLAEADERRALEQKFQEATQLLAK